MKAIAAVSINGVIGINNKLPWRLPADLQYFHELTKNSTLIMGSNTFDSIPNVLPDRNHFILTRKEQELGFSFKRNNSIVKFLSLDELENEDLSNTWVCGGAEIYDLLAPATTELYITLLYQSFIGDTYFPWDCYTGFKMTNSSELITAKNQINYRFLKFERS